jgi:hypothetical protein
MTRPDPAPALEEAPVADIGTDALIDHILVCYHDAHRRDLPDLILLAEKVARVHAGNPALPQGLAELLRETAGLLEMHMKKEELILFPAMRRAPSALVAQPIRVMRGQSRASKRRPTPDTPPASPAPGVPPLLTERKSRPPGERPGFRSFSVFVRQERWIPAFAGMTGVNVGRILVAENMI